MRHGLSSAFPRRTLPALAAALLLSHELARAQVVSPLIDASVTPHPLVPIPWANTGGIAVDDQRNVYVSSYLENMVARIDPFGTVELVMDWSGDGAGNVLEGPETLAIDPAGNLLVCGAAWGGRIFRVTPGGQVSLLVDSSGLFHQPDDIAVDGAGNVYVAGSSSDNIVKVTPAGVASVVLDSTQAALRTPLGVAVDSAGNVFATSLLTDRVFKVTPEGTVSTILTATGHVPGAVLGAPGGVVVDDDGNVYVAGISSDNVFRVTPEGAASVVIDATGDGQGNVLDGPDRMCLDAQGNLLVCARFSDNVFRVAPSGAVERVLGPAGDGAGQTVNTPSGVAVDGWGNVYVAAFDSHNAFKIGAPLQQPPFCDGGDGSLASCQCGAGDPASGCDVPLPAMQGGGTTGGVRLELARQRVAPFNRATLSAGGFPPAGNPAGVVLRSQDIDPFAPVIFGDGLRCVGLPVVRLGAAAAAGGASVHTFGHGAGAGPGVFHYQLWFRSTPASFCDPAEAFNLSNGTRIVW